jgi:hypothetical protein
MENGTYIKTERPVQRKVGITVSKTIIRTPRNVTKALRGPDLADFMNMYDWKKHVMSPPHVNVPRRDGCHDDNRGIEQE